MTPALPIWQRVLFSLLIFTLFLGALEGGLRLAPVLAQRSHGTVAAGPQSAAVVVYCVGDSVTYGLDLEVEQSYPWQLADGLAASGLTDTRVLMIARPGAIARVLSLDVLPELRRLPDNQRPVVYAMYGHNDFFTWDPDATRVAFDDIQAPARTRFGDSLRILRLLRWFRGAAQGATPHLDLNEEHVQMLREALTETRAYVRRRGGDLFLMTYVVPPEPPAVLPAATAAVIHETHLGQARINTTLRKVAGELGVEVLDLEARIDTGPTWSTTWWLDNIHLTPAGLGRVADEVRAHLVASGLLAGPRDGGGS